MKRNLRAVYKDHAIDRACDAHDIVGLCRAVLDMAKEQNEPNDNRTVAVKVLEHVIVDGKMTTKYVFTKTIQPYTRRLTQEEYENQLCQIVDELPEEFRGFVLKRAWDDGHSSGYESVLAIADEIAFELKEPIRLYAKRITELDKTLKKQRGKS